MNQSVEPRKYFDLHLRGLGYLSRVRDVTAKSNGRSKARPFLACAISAFHGDPNVENGVVYLPLDLIVSGEKAKEAVRAVMNDANDPDVKVLVSFRAGDHYIRTFERTGNRAGETGAVLKGRLLKLFWIKVDGQEVYRDEGDREDDDAEASADTSSETVNGHEPSTGNSDHRDTPSADEPANSRDIGASSNDAAAADRTAERTHARSNRYPPLRRHASGSARRPSANAE
ncbi:MULTISPECIES: DUF3577 domain-containing protein [Paraburkholderia]|uniref:DUF3577 domain-containing protein n=1 Tax=Paraburkholderia podalyriae TaxID=1938811 RepID=A0ABR7PSP0_9BURK|nr:DUF3577 domain-containing protein [Paraburkholderia podalyriae]MBC8749271.1 DUF3577 domain-containing protein [Paraburkholderia podalyriae]